MSEAWPLEQEDACSIEEAAIADDQLVLSVSYVGGCETHRFELVLGEVVTMSPDRATPVNLVLKHDARGDSCKALVRVRLEFSLDPVRVALRSASDAPSGPAILYLRDFRIPFPQ